MKNITTAVTCLTLAIGLGMPSDSQAIRMDGGYETNYQCVVSSVSTEGTTWFYKTCWVEFYYTESGYSDYEFNGAYDWMPMGGGGGMWQEAAAITIADGLKVSPSGKKAWSERRNCSDEQSMITAEAQYAASHGGVRPIGFQITLYMPGGQQQTFEKNSNYASTQYIPISQCKVPS